MTKLLDGKIAVVTGAASGVGAEVARLFHAHGASLVLADIADGVSSIADELGDRAVATVSDIGTPSGARGMIDLAVSHYGGIDILCNIAGLSGGRGLLAESSDEDFDRMVAVNLRGPFMTMKAAIPHMIARGGGAIVNVASTAALKGYPTLSAYGASKAGLVSLTRCAAVEYAPHGIRVNAICPGPIETPMYFAAIERVPGAAAKIAAAVPMGRPAKPSEIADPILFLASDMSSFITGSILPVEGGQVA